jgi:hypothetical protein
MSARRQAGNAFTVIKVGAMLTWNNSSAIDAAFHLVQSDDLDRAHGKGA